MTDVDRVREALGNASDFIHNGIDFGYIMMPDADTPDPAHKTPGLITKALTLLEGKVLVDGETPNTCLDCGGNGHYPPDETCHTCGGKGKVSDEIQNEYVDGLLTQIQCLKKGK